MRKVRYYIKALWWLWANHKWCDSRQKRKAFARAMDEAV